MSFLTLRLALVLSKLVNLIVADAVYEFKDDVLSSILLNLFNADEVTDANDVNLSSNEAVLLLIFTICPSIEPV